MGTYIIIAVVVVVFVAARLMGRPSGATRLQAAEKIKQGAIVLDVRSASEFAGGHYANAVNIPVQELAGRTGELGSTDQTVVVYCRSGARSRAAKAILEQTGFRDVINAGGLHHMPR